MIGNLVSFIFASLRFLILMRIILSFLPALHYTRGSLLSQAVGFVYWLTDPILKPFRSLIPPVRLGAAYLDLSPLIAILVLEFLRSFVFGLL